MSTEDTSQTRIALITGGNRGLGRASALHLARAGVDVVITYRTHADEAQGVVEEITALGRTAAALQLDVAAVDTFPGFVDHLRGALDEHWGRSDFDLLFNNAGTALHAPIAATSEADFDAIFAVHVKGPFFLTQQLLPLLRDGGRILNMSSGLARVVAGPMSAYAAAKGAMEVFTRYQAQELGDRGIAVNVIAPGAIATDFGGGMVRDDPSMRSMVASMSALGRVGEADDVGGVVAALLAGDTAWITGQRIEASGGMRL